MSKITPNITCEAKKVYDNLPKTTNKSQFVSEAIIEKASKTQPFTQEQEQRIVKIIKNEFDKWGM